MGAGGAMSESEAAALWEASFEACPPELRAGGGFE